MKVFRYEIRRYDVWGNEKEGFRINDVFLTDHEIALNEEVAVNEIIRLVKRTGLIKRNLHLRLFRVEGKLGDQSVVISHDRYGPLCELWLIPASYFWRYHGQEPEDFTCDPSQNVVCNKCVPKMAAYKNLIRTAIKTEKRRYCRFCGLECNYAANL